MGGRGWDTDPGNRGWVAGIQPKGLTCPWDGTLRNQVVTSQKQNLTELVKKYFLN